MASALGFSIHGGLFTGMTSGRRGNKRLASGTICIPLKSCRKGVDLIDDLENLVVRFWNGIIFLILVNEMENKQNIIDGCPRKSLASKVSLEHYQKVEKVCRTASIDGFLSEPIQNCPSLLVRKRIFGIQRS